MKNGFVCLAFLIASHMVQAGIFTEFRLKTAEGITGTMKAWYQDGNTRSQVVMATPEGMSGGMGKIGNMVMLHLKEQADKNFIIDESSKTYYEGFQNKRRSEDGAEEEYEITILGKEMVNGYNCTHVKASRKSSGRAEMEWWVSKEVSGYKEMAGMKTRQFNTSSIFKAMSEKGLEGFPVKMLIGGRDGKMEMELVKAEKMDIPESKFSLDGYTKKEGMPFGQGGFDRDKIKNMSPEERMKFFQEIQKQMGAPERKKD